MKKYLFILAATAALTSCYDDYVKDNDTQAVENFMPSPTMTDRTSV